MIYTNEGEEVSPKLQIETYLMTRGEMRAAKQAAFEDGQEDNTDEISEIAINDHVYKIS